MLNPNLRHNAYRFFGLIPWFLALCSGCAGLVGHAYFEQVLAPYGATLYTKVIAGFIALVIAVVYWLYFAVLVEVVAFLPKADRSRTMPINLIMLLFVLAASAYPNVQFMAGGHAAEIDSSQYVKEAAVQADQIKADVQQAGQMENVFREAASALFDLATRERQGLLSGTISDAGRTGPVASWIESYAARLRIEADSWAALRPKAEELIVKIDAATAAMNEANTNHALSVQARRAALQAQGNIFRSAVIELSKLYPVAAIETLVSSLRGDQVTPALSSNSATQAGQQKAVEIVAAELKTRAGQIESALEKVRDVKRAPIEPYSPPAIPILVVKHARDLVSAIAAALAIDLLPFGLFLIMARVNDALRRTRMSDEEIENMAVSDVIRAEKAGRLIRSETGKSHMDLLERGSPFFRRDQ